MPIAYNIMCIHYLVSGVRRLVERGECGFSSRNASGHGAGYLDRGQPVPGKRHPRVGLPGRLLPGNVFVATVLRRTLSIARRISYTHNHNKYE